MKKSTVAVLKTTPETVLKDYARLAELAGMAEALDRKATTILKDNISWHFPFPAANTTPWQLEGTIVALRNAGYDDHHLRAEQDRGDGCVQGRRPQQLRPDLPEVRRSRALQLQGDGHEVGPVPSKGEDARAGHDLSRKGSPFPITLSGRTSSICPR